MDMHMYQNIAIQSLFRKIPLLILNADQAIITREEKVTCCSVTAARTLVYARVGGRRQKCWSVASHL